MESWQLALLAVPAVVLIVSVILIVRTLRSPEVEQVHARRVAPPGEDATGGAAPYPDPPRDHLSGQPARRATRGGAQGHDAATIQLPALKRRREAPDAANPARPRGVESMENARGDG